MNVLTPEQVASILQLHPETVMRLMRKGQLPGAKIGGSWRTTREAIDEHLEKTINAFLEGPPGWLIYNTHGIDDEGWGPVSAVYLDELLDRLTRLPGVSVLPVIPALDTALHSMSHLEI